MRRLLPLTALVLAVPLASPAQQPLTCGATITESVTLTEDLDCSGPALTVSGSGITVDLNSHTVSSALPEGCCAATILITGGGNVLQNGRVARTGAEGANIINEGGFNTLQYLTVDGGPLHIIDSTTVANCSFINGAFVTCTDAGLVVENSRFRGPSSGGSAIRGFVCGVTAVRDSFSGYPNAIVSEYTFGGAVIDNSITGGGIYIAEPGGPYRTEIRGNRIRSAPADGIYVADLPYGAIVSDNVVIRSGADGIHIVGSHGDVTVGGNLAVRNLALGIDATNVIDGGGNLARGNGDPRECVGVVCSRPLDRVRP